MNIKNYLLMMLLNTVCVNTPKEQELVPHSANTAQAAAAAAAAADTSMQGNVTQGHVVIGAASVDVNTGVDAGTTNDTVDHTAQNEAANLGTGFPNSSDRNGSVSSITSIVPTDRDRVIRTLIDQIDRLNDSNINAMKYLVTQLLIAQNSEVNNV